MRRTYLSLIVPALLASACATEPRTIEELQTARAVVPQVEASPRAGVAPNHVAEARKALDRANRLEHQHGDLDDIKFEATVATRHAQIANEKILMAQAREEIERAQAERQAVLVEAREREAQRERERAHALEEELADLRARKTERGIVVTMGDVLFDTGKSVLKPGAYTTIERLAKVLQEDPRRKVLIEGHTDSTGSEEYNQSLSERRAAAVQAALFERGVSAGQVSTVGRGETVPVASNADAGGRQQNRRVELVFRDSSRVAAEEQ